MLKGFYRYGDVTVDLVGYDMADTLMFYMSCPLHDTRNKIDYGITIPDEDGDTVYPAKWEELYVSVGPGNVTSSCFTMTEDGVKYKNSLNNVFLSRFGSVLRGMKTSCYTSNRVDALDLMMDGFNPKKVVDYHIETKSGLVGDVSIEMCNIVKMSVKSADGSEELFLEEDYTYDLKVNKQTSTQHKFKLDLADFEREVVEDGWDFGENEEVFSLAEIIERNPEKSYAWLKDRKYHVVTAIHDLEAICKKIYNHDGVVSFDTETTGLNITFKSRIGQGDRLVGLVFSIEEGEAWYFPIAHKKIKNICTPDNENYIIEKYFKPILEKKPILCHNGSFDWKVMHVYDIFLNLVHDTLILYKLSLWNDNRGLGLGLKSLVSTLLNRDSFELSDFVSGKWGSNNIKFWDLDLESTKYYACPDTDNALGLFNYAKKSNLFDRYGMRKIYEVEVGFSVVIAYQEFYGHCADVDRAEELKKEIAEVVEKEYAEMVKIVGHDFNPRSSKDLPQVMFEELGYPVIFKTDTGNPSAGKKALKYLMGKYDMDGNPLYPFAHHLKRWKDSDRLKSNFIDVMGKWATNDGFMFSDVVQFLETGRVSVKDPNYQSYNDTVKKYIVPRSGYYMMDSDYSSVEYRILSSMAGQENLIKNFYDPDTDYHAYQASRMFGVPYELVTKQLRSQAKGINFGLPYGMADPSLGEHIFGEKTAENTLKAKKLRKLYFEGQENVERFFIEARADGVANGFSETHFGRRRYFDRRQKDKSKIEREAGNFRIQGTAADIYKIAMVRLLTTIRKKGWLGKVLISAFVHDECVLEVHKSIDPAIMLATLRECLMLDMDGWCPLYIGAGFGTNWYDAKKTEIPVQVQDIIVDRWGKSGLDWWDGDTEKLFDWEVGLINEYKKNRVIDYIHNKENWGKVIKPVEGGFINEVLDEINAGRHVDGVVDRDVKSKTDVVDSLWEFCKAFGISEEEFKQADIQRPVFDKQESNNALDISYDDEPEEEIDPFSVVKMKVNQLGVALDIPTKKLYFRYDEKDAMFMKTLKGIMSRYPGDFEVMAYKDGEFFTTGLGFDTKGYMSLLSAYMTRQNQRRAMG